MHRFYGFDFNPAYEQEYFLESLTPSRCDCCNTLKVLTGQVIDGDYVDACDNEACPESDAYELEAASCA